MALGATLQADLQALFADPSPDPSTLAQQWADAMQAFTAGVAPPSTTVSTAAATLKLALVPIFTPVSPAVSKAPAMDAAFTAFGIAVGLGMAPLFIATPPPAPPGFVASMLPPFPDTHPAAAIKWSGIFSTWAMTGTATPSVGGAPVPWT